LARWSCSMTLKASMLKQIFLKKCERLLPRGKTLISGHLALHLALDYVLVVLRRTSNPDSPKRSAASIERPRRAPPSATRPPETHWLLVEGRGTNSPPARRMAGLARKLTGRSAGEELTGVEHCAACRQIVEAANGAPKFGSPQKWRQLGTAHHLTTTVRAIQRLLGP